MPLIAWDTFDCGSGIQMREVFASAGKAGILVTYVNSKLRTGALTREKAEKLLPRTTTTAKKANAQTKFLRDCMGKSFSKPVRPGRKQGLATQTSTNEFAGGTRGQRAAQVKPLEE